MFAPRSLLLVASCVISAACGPDASARGDAGTAAVDAHSASRPDGGFSPADAKAPAADTPRTVMVHLFEWSWADIARECELVLGPRGFSAVQVSPPQEHAVFDHAPWWERYQPVSYRIASRSGDRSAFADMVARCAAVNVRVYVDAVLNHMSFRDDGVGSAGTAFTRYSYPGLYGAQDFHGCRRGISDWGSRWEIQNCDLATAPDLDTGASYVRGQLVAYLDDLASLGVAGFRLDGAKHMAATDLQAILGALARPAYVYQEVIDFGDEAVPASEYYATGDVTEFRYSADIARVFRRGQLSWLAEFGEAWGHAPSDVAVVFVDNHDNQRGHGAPADAISFRDGRLHELANIFMLAWPYGAARLMSSYEFTGGDQGPPTGAALEPDGACGAGWICEHRRTSALGMVGFRNATSAARRVDHWWTNDNDQIAFGRGGLGFVVINREEASTITRTFDTGMPAGTYCDVITGGRDGDACAGRTIVVNADGSAQVEVAVSDSVAIHVGSRLP